MDQTQNPYPVITDKKELEEGMVLAPRFGADGLITAIAVDADKGDILMVAHMNAQSLALTLESGEAVYWSRSRQALWRKGETSGQIQRLVEVRVDCDQDAILLRVKVGGYGGCCHTGRRACFYRIVPLGQGAAPHLELAPPH